MTKVLLVTGQVLEVIEPTKDHGVVRRFTSAKESGGFAKVKVAGREGNVYINPDKVVSVD